MRIHITKERNGLRTLLFEPPRGAHLPSLMVRGVTRAGIKQETAIALDTILGERQVPE